MNTTFVQIARTNRIAALETLRLKKLQNAGEGQVICLRTMRNKMQKKPVFVSARAHKFDERLAA